MTEQPLPEADRVERPAAEPFDPWEDKFTSHYRPSSTERASKEPPPEREPANE